MTYTAKNIFRVIIYLSSILYFLVNSQTISYAQSLEENGFIADSVLRKAEEKIRRGDKTQSFNLVKATTTQKRMQMPDTVTTGNYLFASPEARSMSMGYTANANSPWINFIYNERNTVADDFIFTNGYEKMLWNRSSIRWFDTKIPITLLRYHSNFTKAQGEDALLVKLGTNFGKSIGVSLDLDLSSYDGYYNSNKSATKSYGVSAYYRGGAYKAYAFIGNNNYVQNENGGITDYRYISKPEDFGGGRIELGSKDVPVKIDGENLFNRLINGYGILAHSYSFGYYKTEIKAAKQEKNRSLDELLSSQESIDSIKMDTIKTYISFADISHSFEMNKKYRRFIATDDSKDWSKIFDRAISPNYTGSAPDDEFDLMTINNTLSLNLKEGFRPWVVFGLSAFARIENNWFSQIDASTQELYTKKENFNSVFVGGRIARNSGELFNFDINGELGLLGRSLGAINIDADISSNFSLWDENIGLKAYASLKNNPAPYFAEHYHSKYGYWDKDFDFIRSLNFGGLFSLDKIGMKFDVSSSTINNPIYYQKGEAYQHKGIMQILNFRLSEELRLWKYFNFLADVSYQVNTNNDIIALPMLSARLNVWTDFYIARVLRTQIGLDTYWHTAFNAPYWNPAIMQFENQNSEKIGGKTPLMIAYANFKLKQGRFFIRMYNFGELIFDKDRMSIDKYPYNPPYLQMGLLIDLFN